MIQPMLNNDTRSEDNNRKPMNNGKISKDGNTCGVFMCFPDLGLSRVGGGNLGLKNVGPGGWALWGLDW